MAIPAHEELRAALSAISAERALEESPNQYPEKLGGGLTPAQIEAQITRTLSEACDKLVLVAALRRTLADPRHAEWQADYARRMAS